MVIAGAGGNTIDAVIIRPGRFSSKDPSTSHIGTVLFCCPNAGMYECMANASREYSWIGFYGKFGLDVCIYNYRGFSASTGVPSPPALKADVELVVKYLKDNRRVSKLIVHGESIGGMMACHAAKVCGVDMLVCDRTFCSLDAVAERLLGAWASFGLQTICRWQTDVVTDFLAAKCPRLVLQDPNDEIISHCSSLKCGVAVNVLLKDTRWTKKTLPGEYVFSEFKREDQVPTMGLAPLQGPIDLKTDISRVFNESCLAHFTACVVNIGRRANSLLSIRAKVGPTVDDIFASYIVIRVYFFDIFIVFFSYSLSIILPTIYSIISSFSYPYYILLFLTFFFICQITISLILSS